MSNPVDLTQFGQWLTGHQENLMRSLWQEERQAQDDLVKTLKGTQLGALGTEGTHFPSYFRLS